MAYKSGQQYQGPLIEGEPITLDKVEAANQLTDSLYKDFRNRGFIENNTIPPHKLTDAKNYLFSKPEWGDWYNTMKGWSEVRRGIAPMMQNVNLGTLYGLGEEFDNTDGNIAHLVLDPHIKYGALWNPDKMSIAIQNKDTVTPGETGNRIHKIYSATHPATDLLLGAGEPLKPAKKQLDLADAMRGASAGIQGVNVAKAALYKIQNAVDKLPLIREFVRNEPALENVVHLSDKDLIELKKAIIMTYVYKKKFMTEPDYGTWIKGKYNESIRAEDGSTQKSKEEQNETSSVYEYVKKHPDSEYLDFLILKMAMDEYLKTK